MGKLPFAKDPTRVSGLNSAPVGSPFPASPLVLPPCVMRATRLPPLGLDPRELVWIRDDPNRVDLPSLHFNGQNEHGWPVWCENSNPRFCELYAAAR